MSSRGVVVCLFVCVASLFTFPESASAQTNNWTVCAAEGGTCAYTGTQEVRYGANGSYFYRTLTDGTACTNAVFGDPVTGVRKDCALRTATATGEWSVCAAEGGTCAYTGTQEVRYGANGSYFYRTLTGGTACTNAVFGDPVTGVRKDCALRTATATGEWSVCAAEGSSCAFAGTQEVRYGANGSYYYKTLTGGAACTNAVFGDPVYGVRKDCSLRTASDWNFCASEGSTCAFAGTKQVRYGADGSYFYKTVTDSVACHNSVFGDPIYGVRKQCDVAGTAALILPPPPPPPPPPDPIYGPRASITCPAGAVNLWPGSFTPFTINQYPAGTTYCLRAGVHSVSSSVTPKRGDTFVGEYGAVLDGTGWSTSDDTQAPFRAHNQDIDYVTIRNLVIRHMPHQGIHTFYWMSDHWTIEYNEIAYNKWGLEFAPDFTIRNNSIHHNVGNPSSSVPADRGGGYVGGSAHNTTFDSNEIAYNGPEQKVVQSSNVTFTNNFVHHNLRDGIWFDSNTAGGLLIEGNRVEDNGRNGISFEASIGAIIRNNTVRRSAGDGVFISMSQNAQIYSNMLEGNAGGIEYFLYCGALSLGEDVKNNAAYANTVVVGTQSYAYASAFSSTACTSAQVGSYMNGSKNLNFSRNTYKVPSANGRYLLWGSWKYWNEWQALGQDLDGSLSQ